MTRDGKLSPLAAYCYLRVKCVAAVSLCLTFGDLAKSDVFQLDSGGQVVGELVDRGSQGEYIVKSSAGLQVTLTERQVRRVVAQEKNELEYARRSRALPDTADAHRDLAAWCKEAGLKKLVDHHLERLLQIDPDNEQARLSLGYQKHKGRWLTRDEIMAERGLRYHEGSYRTPQAIALRQSKQQREKAEAEWFRQIRTWLGWLDDRRAADAEREIASIGDPSAAPALVKLLQRADDQDVRDLLTSTLAPLKHPAAIHQLVDLSLDDPLPEVRLQCLDFLMQFHLPISLTPYVRALSDPDNEIVNRSAVALRVLGNPGAMSPLIDALVTTHKYANPDAPPGDINAAFSPSGGGGGLSFGGKTKILQIPHQNVEVRRALVELSGGQDFDYNEKAWRRWLVNQQIHDYVDTRRDD